MKGYEHEEVEQLVFIENIMTIISGYNFTKNSTSLGILSMYMSIPISIWVCLLLSYLVFVLIFCIGSKLMEQNSDSVWTTFCAFIHQNSFPSMNKYIGFLSTITIISLFFVMSFILSSIGTDLVVTEKPNVLTSYRDVVDNDVKVAFSNKFPERQKFGEFRAGSLEHKIYENGFSFKLDASTIPKIIAPILNQRTVLIGRESLADTLGYVLLHTCKDTYPNFRILRKQDPNAKKYMNAITYSKRVNPNYISFLRKL